MTDDWIKERIICDLDTCRPGPLLICTAGLHGNEPAGGRAVLRLLEDLDAEDLSRGRFLALTGNMRALASGERRLDIDLNRIWTPQRITALRRDRSAAVHREEEEMADLLAIIDHALDQAQGECFLVDLHSTSGPGAPFACCMEVTQQRQFLEGFSIPLILGLRPHMEGTLIDYMARLGHSAVGVEGGQNEDEDTMACHEDILLAAMAAIRMLADGSSVMVKNARDALRRRSEGLPHYLEVFHRHQVNPEDDFHMLPGFANFSEIQEHQPLAQTQAGPVLAPASGVLLFPRYQSEGSDGFFLARPTEL